VTEPAHTGPAAHGQEPNGQEPSSHEPKSSVPPWLRRLADAAHTMDVPSALIPPATGGRESAVLILFADGPNGPDLLFILRSADLRLHAGQPAFPGGSVDEGDENPAATALREAAEEVGLDPAGVEVIGALPEVYVWRSGFRVMPVLAWWREPHAVAPVDAGEVAAVERVSLAELADPATRVMLEYPGGRTGPAFRVKNMIIWGFTGALVDRLLALGGWEKPWDRGAVLDMGYPGNQAR
jgi:8-oxo-dGTP pyrophosphatase MutT (NUDIX family)